MKSFRRGEAPVPTRILIWGALGIASFLAIGLLITLIPDRISDRPSPVLLDRLTQAKVSFVDGDLIRAEQQLREILFSHPRNPQARVLLVRVLLERGRLEEAKEICGGLLKEDSGNVAATVCLAQALRGLGQADLATVYYRRAAQLRPEDPGIWKALGLLQKEKGDFLEALSSFQESLSIDPKQADLSHQITELAAVKATPAPGLPGRAGGIASFDPLNPRPIDPSSLVPRPQAPDPAQWTQRQGGRIR